jgi:hypothetical protein
MDALVQAVLDWLSHHFNQEYAVITAAPVAFCVCVVLASTLIYFALRGYFWHELSSRDSTIRIHEERHKLKDEKLANFLSKTEDSASPEVKDQIATLRAELNRISGGQQRTITQEQWQIMYEFLRMLPVEERTGIQITVRPDNLEAGRYGIEFQRLFMSLGLGGGMTSSDIPRDIAGLVIRVDSERPRPVIADRLSEALTRAGLKNSIQSLPLRFPVPLDQCELVVGKAA